MMQRKAPRELGVSLLDVDESYAARDSHFPKIVRHRQAPQIPFYCHLPHARHADEYIGVVVDDLGTGNRAKSTIVI